MDGSTSGWLAHHSPPPAPTERKRVIDKHTNLATALLKHIKASSGRPALKLHAPRPIIGSAAQWHAICTDSRLSPCGTCRQPHASRPSSPLPSSDNYSTGQLPLPEEGCPAQPALLSSASLALSPCRTASWTASTRWRRTAWPTRPTAQRCAASCSSRWAAPRTSCASRWSGC